MAAVLLLVVLLTLFTAKASAYYCDHNQCASEQYCCGDNLCCDYVYSLWYFWVGVVFLVLMLSACGGFFRYCYDSRSYVIVPYWASSTQPWKDDTEYLVKDIESSGEQESYLSKSRLQTNLKMSNEFENCYKMKESGSNSPYC